MAFFNVITGMPRSGSTLLCNLLNQRKDTYAGSTSPLAAGIVGAYEGMTKHPSFISCAIHDREAAERALRGALEGAIRGWLPSGHDFIFDKGRGWNHHTTLLRMLFPRARPLVTVRDLRGILGSIEKQHLQTMQFGTLGPYSLQQRLEVQLSGDGVVGRCLSGIEDMIDRRQDVIFVRFEELSAQPLTVLRNIEDALGMPPHDYDIENVKNVAEDVDGFYQYKYPHGRDGAVIPIDPSGWRAHLPESLAREVSQEFDWYQERFAADS